jgi:hypothetical protein
MPELLEESIAEIKEQTTPVADTGAPSGSAIADERQAEPVIERNESTAESSDKLEAPVLSDSASENAMVDESVAVLEVPVAVVEQPVAVLQEPVAVLEEAVAVLEEPVAVLEEPAAAVLDETGALHDEPGAEHAASEAPGLPDEPIELPAIEEQASVLAEPIAEAADQCSVEAAAEAHVVANQVSEIHEQDARVDEADVSV